MHVIGTAGHVDHGKSTLVEALTGINPDRLREEKERGMTIDLGFAWMRLPGGEEASIVEVPGHERFIKNMLAGVGGIDTALLVVAAAVGIALLIRHFWPTVLRWWDQAKDGGQIVAHPGAYFGRVFLPEFVSWVAMVANLAVFLAA